MRVPEYCPFVRYILALLHYNVQAFYIKQESMDDVKSAFKYFFMMAPNVFKKYLRIVVLPGDDVTKIM